MSAKNHASGFEREDRDLLVELRTEMTAVRQDIKELKENTSSRLTLVETSKVDKADEEAYRVQVKMTLDDHEARTRELEVAKTRIITYGSAAMAAISVLQLVLPYITKIAIQ